MNIKQAAELTGLATKTIRYYETVSLVAPLRSANGYRVYDEQDIHNLKFLAMSRSLGFPLATCRQLLGLYQDKDRASSEVKGLAHKHLQDIEAKIDELELMRNTLKKLVTACNGDDRPNCPIIEKLSESASV